jgi:Cft2 family RNA processing exonuclease
MKIHFLGGADEVGASCLLIELGGQNILIDAGIRVSPKARDGLSGELLPDLSILEHKRPHAVIITHAHADHIGAIPQVMSAIPDIPIYTTPATISLMGVMFRDALKIMDARMEAEGELPTYDLLQVQQVEKAFRPTDFKQEFSINGAVNVTFYRAGHIPGAVSVFLQADQGSILVSGDLSFSAMRATPIAEIPPVRPDVLILETTYGGKLHANRLAEEQRLIDSIAEIIEQGGRVLIPAFALGRAQEVALILDSAIANKKLAPIPVYMDGMTRNITKVFERFPDYLAKGLQKHLEDNLTLFRSSSMHYVNSRQQRDELMIRPNPCVIIASSGMMTGGASPLYAQHIVKEPASAIYITGYQDEESPGRALQKLAAHESKTINLLHKRYEVQCKIDTYSLSAHADENELTQYAAQLEPKMVYLVHGEKSARERIRDLIEMRKLGVHLPRIGEASQFDGSKILGRRKPAPPVAPPVPKDVALFEPSLPLFNGEGDLFTRNARKTIRQLLPPSTGLRRLSFIPNEQTVKLVFDFPEVAQRKYQTEIAKIAELLLLKVELSDTTNLNALQLIAKQIVPGMLGRASIYHVERAIEVLVKTVPENWKDIQAKFLEETGFRLVGKASTQGKATMLASPRSSADSSDGKALLTRPPLTQNPFMTSTQVPSARSGVFATPNPAVTRMEINAAYAAIKAELEPLGLYKTSLKNGGIVLSYITPELGERYHEQMEMLAQKTGYAMSIHPHPNQHALILLMLELCEERGIYLVKNPSLAVGERSMMIEVADLMTETQEQSLCFIFYEKTAWQLKIKLPPEI